MNDFAHMWDQIEHDLGWNDHNMQRNRPYNGQPHTDNGIRGSTEIKGITFRDLKDCFIRAYIMSHEYYKEGTLEHIEPNATLSDEASKGEHAVLCENDVFTLVGDADPIAVSQNLSCEIERIMGIFPNVPKLEYKSDTEY